MGRSEPESHDAHLSGPAPSHVAHVASQSAHVCPSDCTYWPRGQVYVHVPSVPSKEPPARHDVQLVAPPALHSAHNESQSMQVPSDAAYLPAGHADMQAPSS